VYKETLTPRTKPNQTKTLYNMIPAIGRDVKMMMVFAKTGK
jgi:hypothetical protein